MDINFKRKDDKNDIELKISQDVPYLFFKNIDNTNKVIHGFSTRLGGVSKQHLSSMNLSFTRGDEKEHVIENYKRITKALDIELESLVLSYQTHTTNIRVVTKKDRGKGIIKERDYTDIDGFITNEPGVTLVTFYADCVPLFFVDPANNAIGLSHSGWRGTVDKIGKKTIEMMKEHYGTRPQDLVVAIGPSICVDCYEVSEDVIEEFRNSFDATMLQKICYRKENGKYQLDLWQANRYILLEAGVKEQNIAVSNICTCCNFDLLYSHRASNGLRGNLAAFIGLKG
jgi:purine-nucleoside/S-methyl-5'-thioadenosine phosphorylase / adenosine deaminase